MNCTNIILGIAHQDILTPRSSGSRKRPREDSNDAPNESRARGPSNPPTRTDSTTIAFGERVKDMALPEDPNNPSAPPLFNQNTAGARSNLSHASARPSGTHAHPSGAPTGTAGTHAGPSGAKRRPSGEQAVSSPGVRPHTSANPKRLFGNNPKPVGTMMIATNSPHARQDGGQARPIAKNNPRLPQVPEAPRRTNPGSAAVRAHPNKPTPTGHRSLPVGHQVASQPIEKSLLDLRLSGKGTSVLFDARRVNTTNIN